MRVELFIEYETLKKNGVHGNLIPLYFYDNKPVYFITKACGTIKLVEKQQNILCKSINKMADMQFYRRNVVAD